jgi:RNA polymerase sigma-70 factor (ECF subfamily)
MTELNAVPMRLLTAGDKVTWDRFVALAAPVLRGVVRRTLVRARAESHVSDVLQDIFLRLCRDDFRLLKTFDPQRASLTTWLGVVAASASIDFLRRQRMETVSMDDVGEADLGHVEAAPIRPLELPAQALPPRQALILRMLFEHDLPVEDVAARLNIEPQTVRSLKHKALTRLRAMFAAGDVIG